MNIPLPTSLCKGKSLLTVLMLVSLFLFSSNVYGQYTISQPAWEGLETLTSPTSVFPADDQTVGPYNIGFDFDFFGNTYSTFYISSNGFISFQNTANGCCSGQLIPNTGQPNNMIAAFYEDFDPPEGGSIRYQTLGSSPNRMLVVEFNSIYPWPGPPTGTTPASTWQLKIKECTNIIDIACLSCNSDGGAHTQGIENAAGTQAFVLAGRNSTNFSLSNDLVRFSPTGSTSFDQIDINDQVISLEENTNSGIQVVDLDDFSSTPSVEYSIINGNSSGYFAINSTSGEITTNSYINFEEILGNVGSTVFNLEVLAEDTDNCLNFDNAIITVEIVNQDEALYEIRQGFTSSFFSDNIFGQSFLTSESLDLLNVTVFFRTVPGVVTLSIFEGQGFTGDLIYTEEFTGVPTGIQSLELSERLTLDEDTYYTFQLEGSSTFQMWYQTGDIYKPGDAYYNNSVQSGNDLYFIMNLGPFNTTPQIDPIPNQEVTENNDPNDAIYVVQAEDPDDDDISYSLAGGGGFFYIDSNTGEIFTNGSLDYESIFAQTTFLPLQYTITVTATDNSFIPKSTNTSFVVNILNEEDEDYSIEQLTSDGSLSGNISIGQSFTTTDAGLLKSISFRVNTTPNENIATFQLWKNSDFNTTSGSGFNGHSETNMIYEREVQISEIGFVTIEIPDDIYLEANSVYSFELFGLGLSLRYRNANLYRRGRLLYINRLYGCCELDFNVEIEASRSNVELLAPSNGQNLPDQSQYVTFTWSADPRTLENNTLYVLIETAGEEPFISEPLNNVTSYQLALDQLSKGKIYRWSIINEEGDQTEERLFKTPLIVVTANTEAFNGSVRTYPNPFNDRFIISVENEVEERLFVQIVDLMGREIYNERSSIKSNNYQFEIAGGAFNKGVYLTRLFSIKNNGAKELLYQGKLVKN